MALPALFERQFLLPRQVLDDLEELALGYRFTLNPDHDEAGVRGRGLRMGGRRRQA